MASKQSWLTGQQMSIDGYLSRPESSAGAGARNKKRKSSLKNVVSAKKAKALSLDDKDDSTCTKRTNSCTFQQQTILADITERQNSPRYQRKYVEPIPSRLQRSESEPGKNGNIKLNELDAGKSLVLNTPVYCKPRGVTLDFCLLTPPESHRRPVGENKKNSDREGPTRENAISCFRTETHTPSAQFDRDPYPTPSLPFSFRSKLTIVNNQTSLFTSETGSEPPSSPPQISALRFRKKPADARPAAMTPREVKEIIPSSQSQYLHYSQKQLSLSPSLTMVVLEPDCIPSSQSQPTVYSPRKVKKPPPLCTKPLRSLSGQNHPKTKANFVVPSSQEDEIEISLPEDVWPTVSQNRRASLHCQMSLPGDSRLTTGANFLSEIEGVEGRITDDTIPSDRVIESSQTQEDSQYHTLLSMRSSLTEPDIGDEDPFSSTNSAYRAFIRQPTLIDSSGWSSIVEEASVSESSQIGDKTVCASLRNDTQSSMTQVDEEEEDPFPSLPPVKLNTAFQIKTTSIEVSSLSGNDDLEGGFSDIESTHEHHDKAHEIQIQRDLVRSSIIRLRYEPSMAQLLNTCPPQTKNSIPLGSMPVFGSFGDSSQIFELSPSFIHTTVHHALQGLSELKLKPESESVVSSGDAEFSVPKEVQDFFSIFDSET